MKNEAIVHIVDDDAAVRDSVGMLLQSSGYQVRTYPSARDFLAGWTYDAPGCLILDVRLSDDDGLVLQRRLVESDLSLPVIMVSGYGDVPTAVAAMRCGALDFLEKPFDESVLLRRVEEAIGLDLQARAERARREAVLHRLGALTPREREVLQLVVSGRPNKQVAAALGISMKTVEAHRAHVMDKMKADSLAELVRMMEAAKEAGVITHPHSVSQSDPAA